MGCSIIKPQQGLTVNNGVDSEITPTQSNLREQGNGSTSVVVSATHVVGGPEAIRQAFLAGTLVTDPRCPLNARQLYGLTKSWKAINRNMSITAINIFVRYVYVYLNHYEIHDERRSSCFLPEADQFVQRTIY